MCTDVLIYTLDNIISVMFMLWLLSDSWPLLTNQATVESIKVVY